jgi:hypothetical protein
VDDVPADSGRVAHITWPKVGSNAVSEVQFSLDQEVLIHLVQTAGALYDEARRCADARCWRAALILIGSAVETGIVATACCLEPELREQGLWPKRHPSSWTLGQAIKLATDADWLPAQSIESEEWSDGALGIATQFLNTVRVIATHPAAVAREQVAPNYTEAAQMEPTYQTFESIMAAVFEELNRIISATSTGSGKSSAA